MAPFRPKIMIGKRKYSSEGYETGDGKPWLGEFLTDTLSNITVGIADTGKPINITPTGDDKPYELVFEPNPPTAEEFEQGSFTRYFLQDTRNGKIEEVTKKTYLKNSTFISYVKGAQVKWILKAPVEDVEFNGVKYKGAISNNKEAVEKAQKLIPNLSSFVTNYAQFIKIDNTDVITNLYTDRSFYILGTLDTYTGFYHIHKRLGIMAGRSHSPEKYGQGKSIILVPQNQSIREEFINKYPFLERIFDELDNRIEGEINGDVKGKVEPRLELPLVSLSERPVSDPTPPVDNKLGPIPVEPLEEKDPDNLPINNNPDFILANSQNFDPFETPTTSEILAATPLQPTEGLELNTQDELPNPGSSDLAEQPINSSNNTGGGGTFPESKEESLSY